MGMYQIKVVSKWRAQTRDILGIFGDYLAQNMGFLGGLVLITTAS